MSESEKLLLLIDGHALMYRAFHAFPPLTTPGGETVGAVYGFTRILLGAIRTLKPTHAIVAFDLAEATFRHHQYEGYKSTRSSAPEELIAQQPRLRQVIESMEIPIYTSPGFEADDVIGTLANQAAKQGFKVVIVSGDQDLLQLVSDDISVYSPGMQNRPTTIFTPTSVEAKYGFPPIAMIDYKALRGDPSDCIPGVPGIGEITAKSLLKDYITLDKLYESLENGTASLKASVEAKLRDNKDQAYLSRELATIEVEAPVEFEEERCTLSLRHPEAIVSLFQELGFKSLMNELPKSHRLITEVTDIFAAPEDAQPSQSEAIDEAVAPVLREMEALGIMVDLPYLATLEQEFDGEISELKRHLFDLAGEEFNPDSPSQVAHVLYETLRIPTTKIRKGKTGYTTDASTLQELSQSYPIAKMLLVYRERMKLQTTYVRPLQLLADPNQRVHTSYAPDTSTGRISSKNPNLQNIPSRSEQGRRIRKAFIASPGYTLLTADYSQIELRIAAHLSGDPVMKELFNGTSRDIHAETAAKMGVDRFTAKMINFSILYGKGAFGFSQDLGISVAEAKRYIEQYFNTYKGLRAYLDETLEKGRVNGYVETMFGRKRYFPELTSGQFQRRAAAEREAVNLPIQGTQAEILKRAMTELDKELKRQNSQAKLLLTVHDELVLEVPPEKLQETAAIVCDIMIHTTTLSVPIEVNVYQGANWADVHKIEALHP